MIWITNEALGSCPSNVRQGYTPFSGIILFLRPSNNRRRYIVTSSLVCWAHTHNGPCIFNGWSIADQSRYEPEAHAITASYNGNGFQNVATWSIAVSIYKAHQRSNDRQGEYWWKEYPINPTSQVLLSSYAYNGMYRCEFYLSKYQHWLLWYCSLAHI